MGVSIIFLTQARFSVIDFYNVKPVDLQMLILLCSKS